MKILTAILIPFSLALPVLFLTHSTSAQFDASTDQACEGLGVDSNDQFIDCDQSSGEINSVLSTALDLLSLVAGIITVVVIIVGGIKYMTSQGDSNAAAQARSTIIYALIGIVIVATSQIIVQFVLSEVSNDAPPPQNTEFDPTPGDGGNTVQ